MPRGSVSSAKAKIEKGTLNFLYISTENSYLLSPF